MLAPGWDCDGGPAQTWTVEADGTIQINGTCLDIYQAGTASKTPVDLSACTGAASQQWRPDHGALVNPATGTCLDDPGHNAANGTQLEIYTCNGGRNQQWQLP